MKVLKSAFASFIATVVLSASGIALATDDATVEVTDNSVVLVEDTQVDDINSTTEDDSDVSDDSQPSEDATSDTDDTEFTWTDCSSYSDADGNLVQRCKGEDADGNQLAKSNVAVEENDSSKLSQPAVSTDSRSSQSQSARTAPALRAQTQSSRPSASQSARTLLRPVVSGVASALVAPSNTSDVELPKLPVTGCEQGNCKVTSVDKDTKSGSHKSASAAVATDNTLIAASSRASLFTMAACAAFVVVGAGSVVSVRRRNH